MLQQDHSSQLLLRLQRGQLVSGPTASATTSVCPEYVHEWLLAELLNAGALNQRLKKHVRVITVQNATLKMS